MKVDMFMDKDIKGRSMNTINDFVEGKIIEFSGQTFSSSEDVQTWLRTFSQQLIEKIGEEIKTNVQLLLEEYKDTEDYQELGKQIQIYLDYLLEK
jgi:hypothetical protein